MLTGHIKMSRGREKYLVDFSHVREYTEEFFHAAMFSKERQVGNRVEVLKNLILFFLFRLRFVLFSYLQRRKLEGKKKVDK